MVGKTMAFLSLSFATDGSVCECWGALAHLINEGERTSGHTPVCPITHHLLHGESQGWGSLLGCSLWGRTESDMTEAT